MDTHDPTREQLRQCLIGLHLKPATALGRFAIERLVHTKALKIIARDAGYKIDNAKRLNGVMLAVLHAESAIEATAIFHRELHRVMTADAPRDRGRRPPLTRKRGAKRGMPPTGPRPYDVG